MEDQKIKNMLDQEVIKRIAPKVGLNLRLECWRQVFVNTVVHTICEGEDNNYRNWSRCSAGKHMKEIQNIQKLCTIYWLYKWNT